jgi:hypothetical protein
MASLETIEAKTFSKDKIILKKIEDIEKVVNLVQNRKDFVLKYMENGAEKAKMITVTRLEAGIKEGSIEIYAEPEN